MSNSSFIGLIKKNYHSLINLFSSDSDAAASSPQCRLNAFNVKFNRRAKFHTLLSQKDTVNKLIHLYRQNECLWNPSCPDYKSSEYQEKVWKNIASAIDTNMPVVPVKRKVHVLRDQWEAAKELPMPNLFDYPDFGFLSQASAAVEEQPNNDQMLESDRMDSGSEQTIQADEAMAVYPSEYVISNKAQHIANLCEV